jgi:Phage integrase SAM-like domain
VSAAITADSLPSATILVLVPLSVHPIQENPTIMIPTAPTTAPRGVTRRNGVWAIRFTCGAGCKHKERSGPLKVEAVRLYHERRNRALSEPGWCPNVERQQARKHTQAEQAREKARVSFRDYATGDYLPAAGGRLKGIATVRCRVQAMVEHFGDVKLDEITPAMVERYLNGLLSQGFTQSTVNRYRGILSAMFSRAKRFGLVTMNPVTGATKYREPEGRTLYLLPEDKAQEEAAIRDALRPDLRPLFTVSSRTQPGHGRLRRAPAEG